MQERPIPTTNSRELDILKEISTSKHIRTRSIDFRERILKDPSAFKDREGELTDAVRDILHQLQKKGGIYSTYARDDMLEGLSAINHPAAQLVIAESTLDKEKSVVNKANRLLAKARTIYPGTITFLWQQEAARENLLSIIEQNKNGGIQDEMRERKAIPEIEDILLKILKENSDVQGHKRAAIIAFLLYERTNGNISPTLFTYSINFLSSEIEKAVVKLSEPIAFVSLIENIVSANLYAAKSSDITQMEITIPENVVSQSEEILSILNKLDPLSSSSQMKTKYLGLLALAKVRAREILQKKITEEKTREERIKATRREEETHLNQQRAALKHKKESAKARAAKERRDEDVLLANQALNWFPDLAPKKN